MADMKCIKCGEIKLLDGFGKDRSKKNGYRPYCKACEKARVAKYYRDNVEKIAERIRLNRDAINAAKRHKYAENVEHYRAYARNKRAARAEAARESAKAWKLKNPNKVLEHRASYYRLNSELEKERAILRKATCKQAIPVWFEKEKVREVYRRAAKLGFHVDHIVPLSNKTVCGLHCWHNLQLLTSLDNSAKGNRHWPHMW